MRETRFSGPRAAKGVTGAPSRGDFMRACYAVQNHGDGTGTIVLDWYETSVGRDYGSSDEFMRVEIGTARKIVALLNSQLPGRVSAQTEYPPEPSAAEAEQAGANARARRGEMAERLYVRFQQVLLEQPEMGSWASKELEREFKKLGEWVAVAGMDPVNYLRHVFIEFPEYIAPVLDAACAADFDPQVAQDVSDLIERVTNFVPAWT